MRRLAQMLGYFLVAATAVAQELPKEQFMVFFDWGKGEIRSDGAAQLDRVAEAWRTRPAAQLRLVGHTDRSGDKAANRAAGLKRAQAVRDELQKRGIPRNAMHVASFGEEQPLVPTEDGVREVQNRRVVIWIEE